jgi:acyl-CoA reductase-like NAD-dependent aldehyde dehydrogenase
LQISDASAADELQLTLDSIKTLYDSLDFPGTLAKEKLVGKGASSLDNLVPLGVVLIDPSPYSPFASILAPLAATVAAGGAAIVLASSKTPNLNTELRTLITKSLDFEAFAITEDDSASTRRQLGAKHFGAAALQNLSERDALFTSLYKANPLVKVLSPPSGTPAAFVDRSAEDLEAISSHLLHAGPRAPRHNLLRIPRLVFVDEIHIEQLDKLIHANTGANALLSFGNDQDKAEALDELIHSKFPSSIGKLSTKRGGLPAVITIADSK